MKNIITLTTVLFTLMLSTPAVHANSSQPKKPWKLTAYSTAEELEPIVLAHFQKLIPLGLTVQEVEAKLKYHLFDEFVYDPYNGVDLSAVYPSSDEEGGFGVTTLRLFADKFEVPSEVAVIYVLAYFAFDEDGQLIKIFSLYAIDGI